jgi:cyclopropane fatty-acyl-phospholipid synthase-like methyltransferase
MSDKIYAGIVQFCESCLEVYGDNYKGVGWTKSQEQADTRYQVMLDVVQEPDSQVTLLDFGCGASHLYEYIQRHGINNIRYSGLDVSQRFLKLSKSKFPHTTYYNIDILEGHSELPEFDYIVANGVFTVKCNLTFGAMCDYFKEVLRRLFSKTKRGLAFNIMSKQVDWEREDLFHLPFDVLACFLTKEISRHFVIRHDYGLYEYTTYVHRAVPTGGRLFAQRQEKSF